MKLNLLLRMLLIAKFKMLCTYGNMTPCTFIMTLVLRDQCFSLNRDRVISLTHCSRFSQSDRSGVAMEQRGRSSWQRTGSVVASGFLIAPPISYFYLGGKWLSGQIIYREGRQSVGGGAVLKIIPPKMSSDQPWGHLPQHSSILSDCIFSGESLFSHMLFPLLKADPGTHSLISEVYCTAAHFKSSLSPP